MAHATHYLPFASLVRVCYTPCTHGDEKPSKQNIDRILFLFFYTKNLTHSQGAPGRFARNKHTQNAKEFFFLKHSFRLCVVLKGM
jgi:hypothetical protein